MSESLPDRLTKLAASARAAGAYELADALTEAAHELRTPLFATLANIRRELEDRPGTLMLTELAGAVKALKERVAQ